MSRIGVAPFGGAWIEIETDSVYSASKDRRTLCGCVDCNGRSVMVSFEWMAGRTPFGCVD
ncbi:hypothetical protein D3C75_1313170 [compost metagenome]